MITSNEEFYKSKQIGSIIENQVINFLLQNGCKIIQNTCNIKSKQDFEIENTKGEHYYLEVKCMNNINIFKKILIEYNG